MDLDKAFDRIPRKVLEWALMKKLIQHVIVRSVMSLNDGAKTRVRVDSELSEEFDEDAPMISAVTFFFCSGRRCCHRICQTGCAKSVTVCL